MPDPYYYRKYYMPSFLYCKGPCSHDLFTFLICFVVNASYQVPSIILLLYEKISILNSYELYNSSNTQEVFDMNSLTAEKRYQFAKWAEVIKSCKSSGIQISEWLKQNNISKEQ